jgi:hypothetical protein
MKRIVIVCIAVLSLISLLAPSHLYAQVPCATLPQPPPPGTINVTITTDNAYLFGFGTAAGVTQLSAAIENCFAADIYTCLPTGVECYNVPANLNSYIYIIAYSDDRDYQGAIAQFTDGYTTVLTQPGLAPAQWEVYATGIPYDPSTGCTGSGPSLTDINDNIDDANTATGPPGSSVTWVNEYSPGAPRGRLEFDPYINDKYNLPPSNDFPLLYVPCIGPAQWMWYNPDPGPAPTYINDPFVEGARPNFPAAEMREYYIFRIGPLGQLLGRNHYKTWRLENPLPVGPYRVSVRDQFMVDSLVLDTIAFLSNPAQKVLEPPMPDGPGLDRTGVLSNPAIKDTFNIVGDTTDHLTWYTAQGSVTLLPVFYKNQFESTWVCIDSVKYLLVPTQKEPHAPPHELDHYKAYRIRDRRTLVRRIHLQDQFDAAPELVDTLVPKYFLAPAQKNDEPDYDTLTHYVAYEIFPKELASPSRATVDQFGSHVLNFDRSELLLVPTEKLPPEACFSIGDVNGDGIGPSIGDCVALIRFVYFMAGLPTDPDYELYQGDLNGDGYIDHADIDLYICYITWGSSCFPQFPIPVPCCTDTVRGCCLTSAGNFVRSEANCDALSGTYLGDGKPCPCYPVPKGTVLWLPFDEGTPGPSMNGAAPFDGIQNGSLVGVSGKVNDALQFDGATSYVDVPSYPDINPGTGDFSIDAWVQRAPGDVGVRVIVDKRSNVGGYFGYEFFLFDNGRLGCQIADGGYNNWATLPGQTVPPTGWHHVALTVERGTTPVGRFYLNGQPYGPTFNPIGYSGSLSSNAPFRVGAISFGGSSVFLGGIDEVQMFRRALTPAEVQAIYDAQNIGKCRCYCPKLGDPNGDEVIDVFDVIELIDIAFGGAPDSQDPLCPATRGDVNNDGVTDVFDVIYLIDTAFMGGPNPVDPCAL